MPITPLKGILNISQLIRYAGAFSTYDQFLKQATDRHVDKKDYHSLD